MIRPIAGIVAGTLLALPALAAVDVDTVLSHYADLAEAKYASSLATAKTLQSAVDQLIETPTEVNLAAARAAWKAARVPLSADRGLSLLQPTGGRMGG